MSTPKTTMAREIAQAASEFQKRTSGRAPESVTAVLGDDTLVITLYGALSPAEKVLAQSPAGAARVQEFHRQLFATSSADLLLEIKRITGVEVREAAAEVASPTGTVVHAFTTGVMVQMFHLAGAMDVLKSHAPPIMSVGRFPNISAPPAGESPPTAIPA